MYVYTRYTECYERNELLEIIFSAKNKKRMVSEEISNETWFDRFSFFFLYKEKAKIILTRLPGKKRCVIIYLGVREI